ncbi:MAG: serine hydrolase domain-containing protein [Balneola sp.]
MNRFLIFILGVFFLVGITISCTEIQSKPSAPKTSDPVIDDTLSQYLQDFEKSFLFGMEQKRIPGASVAIVKDGQVILQKGFGIKEKGKPGTVDENTVFRLGSVSKGFASVLAGTAVEDGLLEWEGIVSDYLDTFELQDNEQTKRVEIKHILSHTSGLPRHAYTNLVEDGLSLNRIISRLDRVPLIAKEGEQIAYQNAAYSVIEKVLEAQTEIDFNTLLQEELFEPLQMNHASSSFQTISFIENKALPHVYHSRQKGRVPIPISKKYYNAVSSGGINASASDMGKWLILLTGNRPDVISKETLNEIFEPLATINNKRFSRHWDGVNQSHYGMGWRILDNQGQRIVYHGGYVNGYRSEIAFAPDQGLGICILINSNSSYPLEVIPGFFNYFREDTPSIAN